MKVESHNEIERPATLPERNLANQGRHGHPARRWWIAVWPLRRAAIVISGILPRIHARAVWIKKRWRWRFPTVSVVHPKRGAPAQEVALPANVQRPILTLLSMLAPMDTLSTGTSTSGHT